MRLLNCKTYKLQTEIGKTKPRYAILSHTWESEEILFYDIEKTSSIRWGAKKGAAKVKNACKRALKDGFDFIWIDTCCIDKESSAELSEAINSMFKWYRESSLCYAYLSDAHLTPDSPESRWFSSIPTSRWFTRGWTLQELLAPDHIHFYDHDWKHLGTRATLAVVITPVTGIPHDILTRGHQDSKATSEHVVKMGAASNVCDYCGSIIEDDVQTILTNISVAERLKWASKRETTREEDLAYCLLGIFDVNMPLLYGEGEKAFLRLQEEILKSSKDHSILAFHSDSTIHKGKDDPIIFAPHPRFFRENIQREWAPLQGHNTMTFSEGKLTISMLVCPMESYMSTHIGILDCTIDNDYLSRPAILLDVLDRGATKFHRGALSSLLRLRDADKGVCTSIDTNRAETFGYDPKAIIRRTITILGNKSSQINDWDVCPPVRLQYFLKKPGQYTMGPTSPLFVAGYFPSVTTGSIGIASFSSPLFVDLFVTWGNSIGFGERRAWCQTWTLSQVQAMRGKTISSAEIVATVEQGSRQLRPHEAEMQDSAQVLVSGKKDKQKLLVKAKISTASFIGRTIVEMTLTGEVV